MKVEFNFYETGDNREKGEKYGILNQLPSGIEIDQS